MSFPETTFWHLNADGGLSFLQGDTHLGGGLDTNGSTESFELVTEENNGEGKGKTDSRSTFLVNVFIIHLNIFSNLIWCLKVG